MSLFFPVGSAVLGTALTVYGGHFAGMRGTDLLLAATVAGVVAVTTALTFASMAGRQVQRVRR